MKVTVIPVIVGTLGTVSNGKEKIERIGNQRKNRDHLDHSIVKIGKNIQKSRLDLRRIAVTQTLVKDHQHSLVKDLSLELII